MRAAFSPSDFWIRHRDGTKTARVRSGSISILGEVASTSGHRLLRYDRRLDVRFVAGADEAGRGSLAGPLVVAGVLFDYASLRGHRARPLALLNDSKKVGAALREGLLQSVLACATHVSVRIVPACDIDRHGLHRSNLDGLAAVLADLAPRAEVCLVDGFDLGPTAPRHQAVVHGDTRSAAIAAASIVAKVTRDRIMRRLDVLHPQYGFARHVGYITPLHEEAVREHGPCNQHRLSYAARCYVPEALEPAA
ncbi:MAG: ribonuclease HII [Thermoleophilia bacterium]|nr:ribonuclease HII [Thermoleophilia bacterium]